MSGLEPGGLSFPAETANVHEVYLQGIAARFGTPIAERYAEFAADVGRMTTLFPLTMDEPVEEWTFAMRVVSLQGALLLGDEQISPHTLNVVTGDVVRLMQRASLGQVALLSLLADWGIPELRRDTVAVLESSPTDVVAVAGAEDFPAANTNLRLRRLCTQLDDPPAEANIPENLERLGKSIDPITHQLFGAVLLKPPTKA